MGLRVDRTKAGGGWGRRERRERYAGSVVALLLASQAVTACVVPGHMNVTQGIAPQNADTNVRFRTTYYFRVFDYCWSADAKVAGDGSPTYRKIVPETDTLYRYRMTGKASALGNQIKFESGTLQKEQIDPFGADVVYNKDIDGYVYRSPEDAKQQAAAAGVARRDEVARRRALADFTTLADMLKAAKDEDQKAELRKALQTALQRYLATNAAQPDPELKAAVEGLSARIKTLEDKGLPAGSLSADVEKLKKDVIALSERAQVTTLDQFCSIGEARRRGFQIMGPEGMRPFDQDARLIMAMHSSAKPLIETLSEYSGRLLRPQVNPADQLLPLARESITVVQTQRALDREAVKFAEGGASKPKTTDIFDAAAQAFSKETK